MKTRVFRSASVAAALALAALAPAFVGCMADSGDGADANQPLIKLTPPKVLEPGCVDPKNACSTTCASTSAGTICDKDCDTVCGFNNIGVKHCTCDSAAFTSCYCVPPTDCDPSAAGIGPDDPRYYTQWSKCWLGTATAPSCTVYGAPNGRTSELINKDCTGQLYAQCVGTDSNTGTDKGCACMPPTKTNSAVPPNKLAWICGSTNRWFTLQ